jgi:hypothetical protein
MLYYSHRDKEANDRPNGREGMNMKKNVVSEVNGIEIFVDTVTFEYYIYLSNLDTKKNGNLNIKSWKTLKGAINWCEKH